MSTVQAKPEKHYACSDCGNTTARNVLTVKKVLFTGMGAGASTTRARVIGWLCPTCTVSDADWRRPPKLQPEERPPIRRGEILD